MDGVKIAGMWELGWNSPIKEVDLWQYPLRDFGISELHMTPVSGIKSRFVQEHQSLEGIIKLHKDFVPVICDERAEVSLPNFKHPKKAIYIFGKANFSPLINLKDRKGAVSLKVDTVENKGLMWPHQVATLILHDRLLKTR